jgi:hypothetical protein
MRSRSPSPSAGESARLINPSAASSAAAAPPTADAPSRRMLLVCLAGVACSTSSVITDEIVDLYAMQQLRLSAATWGRIASAGSASVSLGLLGVAVVVGRAGTRRLGSIALACLGGVLVLLCAVRLELFVLLLGDLFPGLELPVSDIGALGGAINTELLKQSMQLHENSISKIVQTFDSMQTRHCNMLVGHTLGGKSVVWKTLRNAKCALAKAGNPGFKQVLSVVLNPKSVTMDELYGNFDRQTMEWMDGVLSTIFRTMARDGRPIEQWLVLDGPVDTLWIESMNTVMDDNKTLTLINGDRITMSEEMALLFETLDLSVASPATVSRAGMIYLDEIGRAHV